MVEKEWFENNCPKMNKAINESQKQYEIYGIKFMSHTELTYYEIRERAEDVRAFKYFKFKHNRDFVQITLN